MKYLLIFLLSIFFVPLATTPVFAKIFINEFSSYSSDDWVEFYNDTDSDSDLSPYRLRDSTTTNKLDLTGTIPAHGFVAIDWSNKLNKDGDSIRLVKKDDENTIEDEITYGTSDIPIPQANTQSVGRKSDGGNDWAVFASSTKGTSNNSASIILPPTATPTETPKTPTPSKIPTATKVPTPIRTPTPIKSVVTPTKSLSVPSTKAVLAARVSPIIVHNGSPYPTAKLLISPTEKANPKKEVLSEHTDRRNPLSVIAFALGMICVIFCGILVYSYYKKNTGHE